jgi:hypothetical protein
LGHPWDRIIHYLFAGNDLRSWRRTGTGDQSGAFPFPAGSLDSALIAAITPGTADTALPIGDATSSSNLALVEVYDITPN